MPRQRQQVREFPDPGESHVPDHLDGLVALPPPQVELDRLREPGEVVDAQDCVVAEVAAEREHAGVAAAEVAEAAQPERRVLLAGVDHPPGPVQERRCVLDLRLDVDRLVPEDRVHDGREAEPAGGGGGEAGVAVGRPLHRGPHAVAVTEPDVVAHADLVAVVEHRRPGQRQQQGGEELDLVDVVVEQRSEPPPDADVGLHPGVLGVLGPHVVAVVVSDHLERQLVVVAQEDAPLAVGRDRRRLLEDLRDRVARLSAHGHEDARHHREVEAHVALVAAVGVAEVVDDIGRPLVRLREQHPVGVLGVDRLADIPEELVGLGQVLAVGARPLVQVGHGVEPEAVDPHVEPEPKGIEHRLVYRRVVVVEVRLVAVEAVPEVLLAHRVPGPVRRLGVDEDDPRVLVRGVGVRPDVEVAVRPGGVGSGLLEPLVLVARVVHDEVHDHLDAALVCAR